MLHKICIFSLINHCFLYADYPDVVLREQLALKVDLKEERVEVIIKYIHLLLLNYPTKNQKIDKLESRKVLFFHLSHC